MLLVLTIVYCVLHAPTANDKCRVDPNVMLDKMWSPQRLN